MGLQLSLGSPFVRVLVLIYSRWIVVHGERCLALLGVFTVRNDEAVRGLHRRYLSQFPSVTFQSSCTQAQQIMVKFVLCSPRLTSNLQNEQDAHRDLIVLPIKENMNDGKTLDYFSTVVRQPFNVSFVFKVDIDEFVHADNLAASLKN